MRCRRRAAALAAAPLFLLAACGGDADDLVGDGSAASPTGTSQTGDSGGQTTGTGGASGDGLTQQTFAAAVTDAQLKAQTAHVSAEVSASGQQVTIEGDVKVGARLSDYAADITMSAPTMGDGLHIVIVDDSLYMNFGPLTQGKFAKIDLGDTSTPMGQLLSQMMSSADPSASLKAMQDGMTSFQKVGAERIDGVDTTQYRVEVDTRKVLAAQGMGDLPGLAVAQLPDTLAYDLWIGDDNLMRRMDFAMGGAMAMTMNLTAWGEPVEISAPPPSQVSKRDPFAGMPTN